MTFRCGVAADPIYYNALVYPAAIEACGRAVNHFPMKGGEAFHDVREGVIAGKAHLTTSRRVRHPVEMCGWNLLSARLYLLQRNRERISEIVLLQHPDVLSGRGGCCAAGREIRAARTNPAARVMRSAPAAGVVSPMAPHPPPDVVVSVSEAED